MFTAVVAEQVERQLAGVRTNALQILGFALVGLVLALIGIHGVLAYTVSSRTREIGIRGALGASRGAIRAMILRDALSLVTIGLMIGLPVAALATPFIENLLHGTSLSDPSVYMAVIVVVLGASFVASWVPARRASQVDPLTALRNG